MTLTTPENRRFPSLSEFNGTSRRGFHNVESDSASVSSSASEESSISGMSPPQRQMMSLRLCEASVEYQVLNENTVPDAAKELFFLMDNIGRGRDIVPHALKSTIEEKLKDQPMSLRRWDSSFMPQGHDDDLPGRIPSFEEVKIILAKAVGCEKFQGEELMWNGDVLLRLLRGIFEDRLGGQCDDFNAILCTRARPDREFEPMPSTGRMIDVCIYASLDQNQELRAAMAEFCMTAPTATVNHTDFEPLQLRPLVLGIGTRRPGVEWDRAQVQIGIWHASQWAFLRWAVGRKLLKQRVAKGADKGEEEFQAEERAVLSKLGFIPGIIVQGNRWHLVISTYNEGKTTLWAEWVFGTTKSLMDIYSVIAGVRRLTAWARDTYIPWFKENVLM
ncbi:hypothetical protein TsFJ059_000597 [Trichoderma semiorbis]|uniref:PD-(D/E)XK nuclease-like domain-containing protein n=1 Tax=Trichoderma semiorbis TaxID=1491008 RepID=A0A9P8KUH2_9HYPO|nr:hypothetical protein TsFJ059_000597 [Trichoderma semiorbis]